MKNDLRALLEQSEQITSRLTPEQRKEALELMALAMESTKLDEFKQSALATLGKELLDHVAAHPDAFDVTTLASGKAARLKLELIATEQARLEARGRDLVMRLDAAFQTILELEDLKVQPGERQH